MNTIPDRRLIGAGFDFVHGTRMFLSIEHIDDVLPWIQGRTEFVVKRTADYVAIDYQIAFADSFDDERRTELRGLKFYPDGRVMARPLHKFFNLNERPDTDAAVIDLDSDHLIMDKLDGSMIHPAILPDGSIRFMTRMGVTNVAEKAERHMTDKMRGAMLNLLNSGMTPALEFTAPDNRIVVSYEESRLTLLAARETISGRYISRPDLEDMAHALGVPVVRVWERPSSVAELIERVMGLRGAEGIVLQLASGLWLKIKGDEYVRMHRAKDGIRHEKNVLAAILDGLQDDLKPLLAGDDRKRFDDYETGLGKTMVGAATLLARTVEGGASLDQKSFAVDHLKDAPGWLRTTAFTVRAGKAEAFEALRQYMRKHCGTQTDVDSIRELIGTAWTAASTIE